MGRKRPHPSATLFLSGILFASLQCATGDRAAANEWSLDANPARSSDGVYQLTWIGGKQPVVLEESRFEDFAGARALYRGEDRATVISGRAGGTYFYRLRSLSDANSVLAHTSVSVEHHSLGRALGFFTAGLFVFLATVWLVLRGESRAPVPSDPNRGTS